MLKKLRFPIRFKILITILLVITGVVSIITFTMANLFHSDKTAYIHDLTSVMAVNVAEESGSLLNGYRERLQVFSRVMVQRDLGRDLKAKMIKDMFEDFQEFVGVSFYWQGEELATIYDENSLRAAGLSVGDYVKFREEHPVSKAMVTAGKIVVTNSTVNEQLPTMNLALSHPGPDGEGMMIVIATIKLEKLMGLAGRSTAFQTFIVDSENNILAHSNPEMVVQHARMDWIPKLKGALLDRSLGATLEYTHKRTEIIGGFAPVKFSGLLAVVQIPKTAAYLTARELLKNLLGVSLIMLICSAILSLFWSRFITRPLEKLSSAAQVVATGDFDVQVSTSSRDEIGDLAGSFNKMTGELNYREKALQEAQAALIQSEKMAAFGQLGAGIAHEVKNPLAGILGMAQLSLRKVEKESMLERNLKMIEKETKRCKTIIDNLMKFARQEKVAYEMVAINDVVAETLDIVNHQMSINKVKLHREFSEADTAIEGNSNQLQQILMNLMINAQQAMEGEPGNITLETRVTDYGNIEVRVIDDGPGMAEEVRTRIFEPFFTTKIAGKGTGLGLSVSYGIIQDHKGEIEVESEEGVGTTFIITIPAFGTMAKGSMTERRNNGTEKLTAVASE